MTDIKQTNDIEIHTDRFILRPLQPADVSARYLSWLRDAVGARFILTAQDTQHLSDLKKYVAEKAARTDTLFLGIFTRADKLHIGNIKYEPLDRRRQFAVMGILIGDSQWRGKGVALEVINSSSLWLHAHLGIEEIWLGVDHENIPGIKAYQKIGFRPAIDRSKVNLAKTTELSMCWRIRDTQA